MSPPDLAVEHSQALNSAAAANEQVQQQIDEKAAVNGAVPGVESGVIQADRPNAFTQIDKQLSSNQQQITQQNYAQGRQNYENADKGLITAPGELEAATHQGASAVPPTKTLWIKRMKTKLPIASGLD